MVGLWHKPCCIHCCKVFPIKTGAKGHIIMVRLNRQGRVCRAIFACVVGILLLLASVTLLYAALKNWDFTTTTNYTFDSDKIDVSSGLAKLKTVTFIHDEEDEFSGTQSNTQWATDHIELDAAGLSSGSGT